MGPGASWPVVFMSGLSPEDDVDPSEVQLLLLLFFILYCKRPPGHEDDVMEGAGDVGALEAWARWLHVHALRGGRWHD